MGKNLQKEGEAMNIICGFCEKRATWMINGTEPTCDNHLVRALDHYGYVSGYDKLELKRIKRVEDQIIVR